MIFTPQSSISVPFMQPQWTRPKTAGGFVPTDITGCRLWLAADLIPGLSNGDPVATWIDQSGAGNNVVQVLSPKQPIWNTSQINGKPALLFNGTSSSLASAPFTAINQPTTIFAVAKDNGSASFGIIVDGITGPDRNTLAFNNGNGNFVLYAGSVLVGGTVSAGFHYWSGLFNGVVSEGWLDGASTVTGNPGVSPISGFTIGSDPAPSGNYLNGQIAEVIFYDTGLSTMDRQLVEAYLASKYAL